jgi:hypothetical protein
MKPDRAIALAGGQQKDLLKIFLRGRYSLSKQSVSLWVKTGKIPAVREWQLRHLRPQWFNGESMAGKIKQYPKPKRATPKQEQARKKRGQPTKMNPEGPPFRPGEGGTPDTAI